jgi:hypothetical protein
MLERTIGIKETSPGTYRLTFDGTVLGDSRGYTKSQALDAARSFVARDGGLDGGWQGSTWVEFRNVLDASINQE